MQPYLDLLRDVMERGSFKDQRAVLASTGARPKILSLFGPQLEFDLRRGFPVVTTKRVPFRQVAVELCWFLRGDSNVRYLQQHGCHIWDAWADELGELGPVYGQEWRRWGLCEDGVGSIDQIDEVVRGIREVKADPHHPKGRRLVVTAWNPATNWGTRRSTAPLACHTLFQFNVDGPWLDCKLYQRSADLFLGVPFNIASYALLTHVVARVTGLQPRRFIHSFGDAHVYENHWDQVREQLRRQPRELPSLCLSERVTSVDGLEPDMMTLEHYRHDAPLRGEVAV
jgi:thymidylate synthase